MKCPHCGKTMTTAIYHNGRGPRCPFCWERVVEETVSPDEPNATDAARDLARDSGLDIQSIKGSGTGGRVTKKDVEALL